MLHTLAKLDLIARHVVALGGAPNTILFSHARDVPNIEAAWEKLDGSVNERARTIASNWIDTQVFTAFPTPWAGDSCTCFFCDPEHFQG